MKHELLTLSVFNEPTLKAGAGNDTNKTALLTFFVHLFLSVLLGWGITHLISSILNLKIYEPEFIPALIMFAALLYLMLKTPWGAVPMVIFGVLHIILAIFFKDMVLSEIQALIYACMDPATAENQEVTHILLLFGYLNIFFGMSVPVLRMKPFFLAFVPLLPVVIFLSVKQSPSLSSVVITAVSLLSIFLSGRALRTMEAMDDNIPYQARVILPLALISLILVLCLSLLFKAAVYDPFEEHFTKASEMVTEDFFKDLLDRLPGKYVRPDGKPEESQETEPTKIPPEKKDQNKEDQDAPAPVVDPEEEGPGTKHTLSFRALMMILLPLLIAGYLILRFLRYHTALLSRKSFERGSKRETYRAVYEAIKKQAVLRKTPFNEDSTPEDVCKLYPDIPQETVNKLQKEAKEASYSEHEFTDSQTENIFRLYKSRSFLKKQNKKP